MLEIVLYTSFAFIFYTYVGYPSLLYIWSLLRDRPIFSHPSDGLPKISFLIAVFNEEDIILDKLENIKNMDYPAHLLEILIGSDSSDDETNLLITNSNIENLKLIPFSERRGKSAVLNDLAEIATGEIFAFSDANSMFASDALKKLIEPFSDNSIGGVIGNLSFDLTNIDNPGGIGETIYFKYENIIKLLEGEIYSTIVANGAVYAIRKELYSFIPIYKLVTDDMFIPLSIVKQGYRIIFRKDVKVTETPSLSIREEYQKKSRVVTGGMEVVRLFGLLLNPKYGFISFALWSHKIFRWSIPLFLTAAYIANVLTVIQYGKFIELLVFQSLFYLAALIGMIFEKSNIKILPLRLIYYFVTVNIAVVLGFLRFLRGTERATWQRTRRR